MDSRWYIKRFSRSVDLFVFKHDFESCASANSATSARYALVSRGLSRMRHRVLLAMIRITRRWIIRDIKTRVSGVVRVSILRGTVSIIKA
jgi:hypothetical protein